MAAPTITGSRKDTFRVRLTVNGRDWGIWQNKTGGKTSGNTTKIKPGAMKKERSLGGVPTTDTITLTRNYDRVRDHQHVGLLYNAVGTGVCVVSQQPLDADGNAYGRPVAWNGTLDAFTGPPDVDAESTDSAEMSVDVTPVGTPAT